MAAIRENSLAKSAEAFAIRGISTRMLSAGVSGPVHILRIYVRAIEQISPDKLTSTAPDKLDFASKLLSCTP